ncbi:MAG TPA: hypothetical protein H9668_03875 [Firmicutes bacterium]|nr:hypothetical protein [Bacillota bacterium]
MKRFCTVLLICIMACLALLPASAAEDGLSACEQEVVLRLEVEMETVNGKVVLPDRDIAQATQFFQKYEVEESACTAVIQALGNIREILRPLDYASYDEIPADSREALRRELQNMAAALGASYEEADGKFSFVRDGETVFEEDVRVAVPVQPNANLGVAIAIVVLLVGGVFFAVIGSRKFETAK